MQSTNKLTNTIPNGDHYLCELYGCDPKQINNEEFLKNAFLEALQNSTVSTLHDYFYTFEPQGVTGFFLLSASHISLHTWPEYNYIVFDVFSCSGDEEDTRKIVDGVCAVLSHAEKKVICVKRGYAIDGSYE